MNNEMDAVDLVYHTTPYSRLRNYHDQLAMIIRARDGWEILYWGA